MDLDEWETTTAPEKCDESNHITLVSTNDAIDATQWREYLLRHFDEHLRDPKSKVLILAGVHGRTDGQIRTKYKDSLYEMSFNQIEIIRNELGHEGQEGEMEIKILDLRIHCKNGEVREEELAKEIKAFDPTLVVLAFCYTRNSRLVKALENMKIIPKYFSSTQYCRMPLKYDYLRVGDTNTFTPRRQSV